MCNLWYVPCPAYILQWINRLQGEENLEKRPCISLTFAFYYGHQHYFAFNVVWWIRVLNVWKCFISQDHVLKKDKITRGAIHLTKISGNSGTKSNGTEHFWKFVSKIVDNLRRLSENSEKTECTENPVPVNDFCSAPVSPINMAVNPGQKFQCASCLLFADNLTDLLIHDCVSFGK